MAGTYKYILIKDKILFSVNTQLVKELIPFSLPTGWMRVCKKYQVRAYRTYKYQKSYNYWPGLWKCTEWRQKTGYTWLRH